MKTKGWIKTKLFKPIIPIESGNYAIYVRDNDITGKNKVVLMYIGTAKNLYKRIKSHPILKVVDSMADSEICWFDRVVIKYCIEENDEERKRREFNLINRVRPLLNTQGT